MVEITDKLIQLKPKTIVIALIFLFSFTTPLLISGALIYFEFRTMQTQITNLEELQVKDNINTNGRIDKKTGRNTDRIKQLEKSGSDNK